MGIKPAQSPGLFTLCVVVELGKLKEGVGELFQLIRRRKRKDRDETSLGAHA